MMLQDLDRCLNLWIHQNTLLWGRLQTISWLQVPVIGGWYYLFVGNHFLTASLLAIFGTFLSYCVHTLINCDLALRKMYRDEIEKIAPGFLPSHNKTPGHVIITRISAFFCIIDWSMTVVTATVAYLAYTGKCGMPLETIFPTKI